MSEKESLVVMPIGKYKGQPVEILREDSSYKDWLLAQDWFKSKFGDIHTLILNNFQVPHNTPEHNALQARFLDCSWLTKFLSFREDFELKEASVRFEHCGYDVVIFGQLGRRGEIDRGADVILGVQLKPVVGDDYPAILRALKAANKVPYFLDATKEADFKILGYLEYTGAGVSEDTFIKIMENEGISAIKIPQT